MTECCSDNGYTLAGVTVFQYMGRYGRVSCEVLQKKTECVCVCVLICKLLSVTFWHDVIMHLMLSSCLRIIGMWWSFYLTTVSWLFHTYVNIHWKWYFLWWVLYIISSTSLTASQIRSFLAIFWSGLCLTILLCFARFALLCSTPNASFLIAKCSCCPRIYDTSVIFVHNNNTLWYPVMIVFA